MNLINLCFSERAKEHPEPFPREAQHWDTEIHQGLFHHLFDPVLKVVWWQLKSTKAIKLIINEISYFKLNQHFLETLKDD